ncbi:MAG TPA: T9SS type A sorting domain-containing protein [Prolixibacteraceae bacterium]|nr:T9SS type A sorting domain-containing protein [Prolixibacteraceae bacterium]
MNLLKWILPGLVWFCANGATAQYTSTAFYMVAHQDDWQYFMGSDAWQDLKNKDTKVVFIYLTAGDACKGCRTCASGFPYFASREEGAKNAVYLAKDEERNPQEVSAATPNRMTWFNGHAVARWQFKNVVKYFIRLPDGRVHEKNGNAYICRLNDTDSCIINYFRRGLLTNLADITGGAIYQNWRELAATISSVMRYETNGTASFLHTHEFSPTLNAGTHPDHRETGLLADFVRLQLPGLVTFFHLDYITQNMDENLTVTESKAESDLFLAYDAAKTSYNCLTDYYLKGMEWCKRNYISRTETTPPSAPGKVGQPFFVVEYSSGNQGNISLRVNLPTPDIISCLLYDINGNVFRIATDQPVESTGIYIFRLEPVNTGIYLVKIFSKSGLRTDAKIFIK